MARVRGRFVLAFVSLLAACPRHRPPPDETKDVATVNGEPIPRATYEEELNRELAFVEDSAGQPAQVEPMKQQLLKTLVDQALLLQAAKTVKIAVSSEEIDRGMERMSAEYSEERFKEAMAHGQMTLGELKQKTAALLTIEKLFLEQVYARVAVTEGEIRSYYQSHREEFREPEQVHAAQIVVKTLEDAKRAQQQLRAGKKFSDLARKDSLSPDAKVGGDLGFFSRGKMPPQFDLVAFKLGVNQLSEIVATDYGFHIFKVLEKRPARSLELAEVRIRIQEKLLNQKREQAQTEYLQSLRRSAKIQIHQAALAAVIVKPKSTEAETAEP